MFSAGPEINDVQDGGWHKWRGEIRASPTIDTIDWTQNLEERR